MTEKLQDEIYQLENKQVKSAKLRVEGTKRSKMFFKVLERQNMQNQTIFELHIQLI